MQPIKLVIEGDYFDSQIYSGVLYLWDMNGFVHSINFDELVLSLISNEKDFFAAHCAFLEGRYLFKSGVQNLLRDQEFKDLLLKKINRLQGSTLEISKKKLSYYRKKRGTQDLPGGEIHIDSEIYSNKLYVSNDHGLHSFSIRSGTKFPISTRDIKLWDQRILSLKASTYPQFALSAGSEGLFELNNSNLRYSDLKLVDKTSGIYEVSKEHSNYSDYNSLSLYSSSFVGTSGLFQFGWEDKAGINKNKKAGKVFKRKIEQEKIFNESGEYVSWGSGGKLYCLKDDQIHSVDYTSYSEGNEDISPFLELEKKNSKKIKSSNFGNPLSGLNAYFGIIVERENGLQVFRSDNKLTEISGPITKWRVFPRSKNYENHLHVIKDDSIEVYSFYHDFILSTVDKFYGLDSHNDISEFDDLYDRNFKYYRRRKNKNNQ